MDKLKLIDDMKKQYFELVEKRAKDIDETVEHTQNSMQQIFDHEMN